MDSNHKPYFGSICLANSAHPLMRLLSILSVFRQLKGSGGSRTHSVKELQFYRPLSAPIEADPLAVATGVEPANTQLKAVWLYHFAYATLKNLLYIRGTYSTERRNWELNPDVQFWRLTC